MPTLAPAPPTAETLKADVAALVGGDLAAAMAEYDRELASDNPVLADLLEHTSRFRGKQLRPTLLLLSAAATGGVRDEHRTTAAVVEMVHVATLLHDDVLDEADVRRHVATVNGRWNNESAVLFGDYLFTHAFHLAASLPTPHAARAIGAATNRVCEGELTQVAHRGDLDLDEATYYRIVEGKTAELCAVACRLGAEQGGEPAAAALERFGRHLGVAFQIADDLLDLGGDRRLTGKTLGTDLQKQKLTLPVIRLLATAAPADRAAIERLLKHPNEATRTALDPFLRSSDAAEYAAAAARRAAGQAVESLAGLPDSPAKRLLVRTAEFAVRRQS